VGACRVSIAVTGSCSLENRRGRLRPDTLRGEQHLLREPAGRLALHLYPTPWSGIELTGALGNNGVNNTLGDARRRSFICPFLRISAGAE